MLLVIGLILVFVVAAISILSPTWALFLFWPVTWMYPTSLFHGMLPFNIRFDDLFMVWLTITCLRAMPKDLLGSRGFLVALLWFLSIALGNVAGLVTSESYAIRAIMRDIAKAMHVPMIALSITTLIRSERDARRLFWAMAVGATGSFIIGIVQVYSPELVAWWEIPQTDLGALSESEKSELFNVDVTQRRAGGSVGATALAIMGFCMALIGLRLAINDRGFMRKLGYAGTSIAGLLGLGYTITRGAIAGLAGAMLYCVFFQNRKAATALLIVAGLVLLGTQTDLGERLEKRIEGRGGSAAAAVEDSAEIRKNLWLTYLKNWSPHYFLFGRGFVAELVRQESAVHSSYVGALAYTGMFGVGVLIWLVVTIWRLSNGLLRVEQDPFYIAMAESTLAITVAFLVNGISAELWQQPQIILFALVSVVDNRMRMHQEAWTSYVPPEAAARPAPAAARYPRERWATTPLRRA